MICSNCLRAARVNREIFDLIWHEMPHVDYGYAHHPRDCGCPCMHKDPQQWEKQFSSPRKQNG